MYRYVVNMDSTATTATYATMAYTRATFFLTSSPSM